MFPGFVLAETAGDYLLGAPQWLVPATVIVVALAGIVFWNYTQRGVATPLRIVASLLKLIAIGLLALCLLQPMRAASRPRPQANLLPIVVDNSQSMLLKLAKGSQTRATRVADRIHDELAWRVRVAQDFDVRTYTFDRRLESVDSLNELSADGFASSLAGSLTSLADRFSGRPIGGVVLFTDGNLTDQPDDVDWSKLGFPVYPVLPTQDAPVRDLRIADLSAATTDFESAPMTVRAKIAAVQMDGEKVFVQLRQESTGKMVEEQTIDASGQSQEVVFRFRPEQPGFQIYRLIAFTQDDRERFVDGKIESGDESSEATLANNQWLVSIDRKAGPYRVLYLAGRPNWEFKFMRRALQEDAEVQLVGLLRVAKQEPKFSFRDQTVSSTNPLFRGLSEDEQDAAEQYDEPVILRLGVKESEELSDGFPDSADELFAYHAVILDDIEPEFFSEDQALLLRKFVSARGGGLLMLGGQESFTGKNFREGPLGELSPVYPSQTSDLAEAGTYRLEMTREGMLQPWIRLRDNEISENNRISEMPPFSSVNAVGEVKPGASELATVSDGEGALRPAVVAQRFGKGRTAAVLIADLWRWSMHRRDVDRDDPAQAWRQLTHWIVNEVPRRAETRIESSGDPNAPVRIVTTARDDAYLPLDNATVELTITPTAGGEPFTITAPSDDKDAGVYTTTYWARQPGGYHVTAKVTAPDGESVGESESGWAVQDGGSEFQDLQINRQLLETIAEQTGGEVIDDNELDRFAASLPNRKLPVTETKLFPLWHRPYVLCLALLCLCGEWGLRRWKGLA